MSDRTFQPATVFFYVWICASACVPVHMLNQTDSTKVLPYNASNKTALHIPTSATFPVGEDKSGGNFKLKVTQEGKGVNLPSSHTLQEILRSNGQAIVKRQIEVQDGDDFTACSSDHIDPTFIEPASCPFGGETFRLCLPGQFKSDKCVKDRSDFCKFCAPGETFMTDNNNCTACKPCTTCGPNEQVAVACTIHDDTQCEPRSPSTVSLAPGVLSCPPCPVTQVITSHEPTQYSTSQLDATSGLKTSPFETSVSSPISECPECVCNCSKQCEHIPDEVASPPCPERITLYVFVGVQGSFIFIMLIILVWGFFKYLDLQNQLSEQKNQTRDIKKEGQGPQPGPSVKAAGKSNGIAGKRKGYAPVAQEEEIEMTEDVSHEHNGTNGNTSQLPLLGEGEEDTMPVGGYSKEPPYARVDAHGEANGRDGPMSLNSLDAHPSSSKSDRVDPQKDDSFVIAPLSEEDEEKEKAEAASSTSRDPPYERPDIDRKTKSVKGRIENTSVNGPPPLPVRNEQKLNRSKTLNIGSQPRDPLSSVIVKAEVHSPGEDLNSSLAHSARFENPGFEPSMSTMPSEARLGHMNPLEDIVNRTEPEPSSPQKSHNKLNALKRFLPGGSRKKSKSDAEQKTQTSSEASPGASGQNVQNAQEPVSNAQGLPSGASTSSVNIEDLYAKVDKNRKKTPPAKSVHPSSDQKDKPTELRVNTKVPSDTLSDPMSPDDIGSVSSPLILSTDVSVNKPNLGMSPTSDLTDGQLTHALQSHRDENDNEQNPDAENNTSATGNVSLQSNKPKSSRDVGAEDSQRVPTTNGADGSLLPNGSVTVSQESKPKSTEDADPDRTLPSKSHGSTESGNAETSTPKESSKEDQMASGDSTQNKTATKKIPEETMADDEDLDTVAMNLTPDDLRALYRHLKLTDAIVQQAEHDCRSDRIREKAVSVLQVWRQKNGRKASRWAIISALRSSQNNEKADLLEAVFDSEYSKSGKSDMRESII